MGIDVMICEFVESICEIIYLEVEFVWDCDKFDGIFWKFMDLSCLY